MYLLTFTDEAIRWTSDPQQEKNNEWIIKFVPEFVRIGQNCSSIYRIGYFVLESNRRPLKWSFRPYTLLLLLICRPACPVVLYTCQQGSHVYKDHFDGNAQFLFLTFHFQFFLFFQFYLSFTHSFTSLHFIQTHQTSPFLKLVPSSS